MSGKSFKDKMGAILFFGVIGIIFIVVLALVCANLIDGKEDDLFNP